MTKIWTKLLLVSFLYFLWIGSSFAANVDHFNVTLEPNIARVGEALDLTIEAVDRNGATVTNYLWTVLIFSESDPEASLPIILEDNTYTFRSSDLGKTKFENAVKFSIPGRQNIYVYDFDDDLVFGVADATIEGSWPAAQRDISIISPENGLTIWENRIKISGLTERNHQVKIMVNGTESSIVMTNDSGSFEKEITGLNGWENTFKAILLDANNNEIWTSNEVRIRIEENAISLLSTRVTPTEVETEWAFELEVSATAGLREVSAVLDSIITILEEKSSWKYLAKMYAPNEVGVYNIDVTLKDEFWHERKELGAASISVKEAEITEVDPNEDLNAAIVGFRPLKITGLKLVELKSKSVLTWNEVPWAKSYNVYRKKENWNLELIINVTEPVFEVLIDMTKEDIEYEYFAVKAVGETDEGEEYEWELSEATKIQTWPEEIILLLLALLLGGMITVFARRRKA